MLDDALDTLASFLGSVSPEQWVAAGATFAAAVALIALGRRFVPRWCGAVLAWIDRLVPAELEEVSSTTARVVVWLWAGLVLAAGALGIAAILDSDAHVITDPLTSAAATAGGWLAPRLLRVGVIVLAAMVVIRVIRSAVPRAVARYVRHRGHDEREVESEIEQRTSTLSGFATAAASWVVVAVTAFVSLSELGFDIGPLLAGAGVAGVAIGFGAQHLIRDVFAGVFILLEDHYRLGDVVEIAGADGTVEDINLRRTLLRDLDNVVHVIPNGEIRVASNMTSLKSAVHLDIDVAYKEDIGRCIEILDRVGREMHDEDWGDGAMLGPIAVMRVNGFGSSGIAIKVKGETLPGEQWRTGGEFRRRVKEAFDAEGIEIPFPHRTLYWGNAPSDPSSSLSPGASSSATGGDGRVDRGDDRGREVGHPGNVS